MNDSCDRSNTAYSAYVPDEAIIRQLIPLMKNKTITMVIGTWCGDSKTHVPPFYKILDASGFPEQSTTLICVDREKKALGDAIDHLDIKSVPTIIIFENQQEIGRIVEHPETSLEQDLLHILLNR